MEWKRTGHAGPERRARDTHGAHRDHDGCPATADRPLLRLVARHGERAPDDAPDGLRARASALGVPYLRLPRPLPLACARVLPLSLATAWRVVPVGMAREAVTIAFDTLWTERQLGRLRLELGQPVFPVLTSRAEIDWALAHWPGDDSAREE